MEARRNALLADMARDADSSGRTSSPARASSSTGSWPPTSDRIQQLGGLVLIDDDPDYLAVTADGTFRSRSRDLDDVDAASGSPRPRSSRPPPSSSRSTTRPTSSRRSPTPRARRRRRRRADRRGRPRGRRRDRADEASRRRGAIRTPRRPTSGPPASRRSARSTTTSCAAQRLYDLALDFQERSQRTEARPARAVRERGDRACSATIGDLIIIDDDDEQLTLGAGGFRAEV